MIFTQVHTYLGSVHAYRVGPCISLMQGLSTGGMHAPRDSWAGPRGHAWAAAMCELPPPCGGAQSYVGGGGSLHTVAAAAPRPAMHNPPTRLAAEGTLLYIWLPGRIISKKRWKTPALMHLFKYMFLDSAARGLNCSMMYPKTASFMFHASPYYLITCTQYFQ